MPLYFIFWDYKYIHGCIINFTSDQVYPPKHNFTTGSLKGIMAIRYYFLLMLVVGMNLIGSANARPLNATQMERPKMQPNKTVVGTRPSGKLWMQDKLKARSAIDENKRGVPAGPDPQHHQ